jgi:hypothetical protein
MRVVGLDGGEYVWRLTGHAARGGGRPESSYHRAARDLLRRLFPADRILEEVFLPGLPAAEYADFYLPLRVLMVEVQGEQHYGFTPHFHRHRPGYLAALGRDLDKRRWCELNDISLVELPYSEDADAWTRRIVAAHTAAPPAADGG